MRTSITTATRGQYVVGRDNGRHGVAECSRSGSDTETVSVVSDRSTLKEKLQSLVATYNDIQFALNALSNGSDEEEVGGALAGICYSNRERHGISSGDADSLPLRAASVVCVISA